MSGSVVAAAAAEGGVRASAVTDGLVGLYAAAERLHRAERRRRRAGKRRVGRSKKRGGVPGEGPERSFRSSGRPAPFLVGHLPRAVP